MQNTIEKKHPFDPVVIGERIPISLHPEVENSGVRDPVKEEDSVLSELQHIALPSKDHTQQPNVKGPHLVVIRGDKKGEPSAPFLRKLKKRWDEIRMNKYDTVIEERKAA